MVVTTVCATGSADTLHCRTYIFSLLQFVHAILLHISVRVHKDAFLKAMKNIFAMCTSCLSNSPS